MHRATVILGMRTGHGIARHGHHGDVAGVDKTCRQHGQGRLAADAVIDLGIGVQRHAKLTVHEPRDGLFEISNPIIRITAVLGSIDLASHALADDLICHAVVFPDAEVDQRAVRVVSQALRLARLIFSNL